MEQVLSNVIDFEKAKLERTQHTCGEAFCIGCGYEWIAVAPTGTTRFECPECKAFKGLYRFEFMPEEGQLVATCPCSNQLYYLTPEGHMCANCGRYISYS